VFVDSSFWVAISDDRDQWHSRAVAIRQHVVSGVKVLDFGVSESLTIVGSRKGGKPAQRLYEVFRDSCTILYADSELLEAAMERHLKHDGQLSVADCATVEAMLQTDDRNILSFDSDFDLVRGLNRLH
jgi:predicted nucleic acid-binding protein